VQGLNFVSLYTTAIRRSLEAKVGSSAIYSVLQCAENIGRQRTFYLSPHKVKEKGLSQYKKKVSCLKTQANIESMVCTQFWKGI
jgi:hypothetical protein